MFRHSIVSSAPYTVNSFVITQREWTRNTLRKRRLISFQAFRLIFQLCFVHLWKLSGSVGFWAPIAWQRGLCSGAARWELIWEVIKTRGFSVISAAMHSCFTQQVTGIAEIDKSPWSNKWGQTWSLLSVSTPLGGSSSPFPGLTHVTALTPRVSASVTHRDWWSTGPLRLHVTETKLAMDETCGPVCYMSFQPIAWWPSA